MCSQSVILTLLVGLCAPTAALSQSRPTTQPVQWQKDERGWTAFVPMENAPFPHASRENGFTHGDRTFARDPHYTDSTVALFVPRTFKPDERTDLLIYFHGHMTNVRRALAFFKYRASRTRTALGVRRRPPLTGPSAAPRA